MMDKQAFDLMMSRFDNLDGSIDEIKGMQKDHGTRLGSLEETRAKQRVSLSILSVLVTTFSGVASWLASHTR